MALGLVAAMAFVSADAAWAGGTGPRPHGSGPASALKTYHQELAAYKAERAAIETTFRMSVATARSNYQHALAGATTSAERSTIQQTMETAIIQAAATRSAALVALGSPPTYPPSASSSLGNL